MGLFDKLGGNKEISLTPQAGFTISSNHNGRSRRRCR